MPAPHLTEYGATATQNVVTGNFTATGQSAAFVPAVGRGFNLSLWGTFSATVQLQRSFDNGITLLPLTANGATVESFTAPCSEQWQDDEVGVQYFLVCTAFTSGTINYRISQ